MFMAEISVLYWKWKASIGTAIYLRRVVFKQTIYAAISRDAPISLHCRTDGVQVLALIT